MEEETPSQVHRLALPVGTLIEEYRLDSVLGKGGFGLTYLATDTMLQKLVAIKELLPDGIATRIGGSTVVAQTRALEESYSWARDRFQQEARVLASLNHPNIVKVARIIEANGTVYMVMEFVHGRNFGDTIKGSAERIERRRLESILFASMDGLQCVHEKGILHRDIKPDNIFITNDGHPVLIDFGSAREALGRSVSMTAIVSAGYSPFEQYTTRGKQGPWSDVYSLAGTMVFALTKESPLQATDRVGEPEAPGWLAAKLGEPADTPFLKAIEKGFAVQANERPQSIQEWRSMFGATAATTVSQTSTVRSQTSPPTLPPTPPDSHTTASHPPQKRSGFPVVGLILGGLTILLCGLIALYFGAQYYADKEYEAGVVAFNKSAGSADDAIAAQHLARARQLGVEASGPYLGMLYAEGRGISQDYKQARTLLVLSKEPKFQFALGKLYEEGLGGDQDIPKALECYQIAAEAGIEEAQRKLVELLMNDKSSPQDFKKGLVWCQKIADAGDKDATLRLAEIYSGQNAYRDLKEASIWYRKAAEGGNASAQFYVGNLLSTGEGGEVDLPRAAEWFQKAALQGHVRAQYELGLAYKNGKGLAPNADEAVKWYSKAANQGNIDAQNNLGRMYGLGEGIPKEPEIAFKWFSLAANAGNPDAQANLAMHYMSGSGVAKDPVKGADWLQKAAAQGRAGAQYNYGLCLMSGNGRTADPVEAMDWFRKAADQEYAPAQCNLGYGYEKGSGVAANPAEAFSWYSRAAAKSPMAQYNLGRCYIEGIGVAKDPEQAKVWLRKAEKNGDKDAAALLQSLGN